MKKIPKKTLLAIMLALISSSIYCQKKILQKYFSGFTTDLPQIEENRTIDKCCEILNIIKDKAIFVYKENNFFYKILSNPDSREYIENYDAILNPQFNLIMNNFSFTANSEGNFDNNNLQISFSKANSYENNLIEFSCRINHLYLGQYPTFNHGGTIKLAVALSLHQDDYSPFVRQQLDYIITSQNSDNTGEVTVESTKEIKNCPIKQ